ncbi:homeobox-leucine zipper protein HDG1-like [Bidens hawaiensis]|uniref:homeobox-leucine zipper protein HDG1-like n=1 Tax=Bidens hawaiensis TaxID=980011 RepID=UPI00404AD69E
MEGHGDHGLIGENFEGNVGMVRAIDGSEISRSGGSDNADGASGDEQDIPAGSSSGSRRRLKYHRHTPYQIQELENAYKENPHPDEKDRLALGKKLNLENKQVKFWFQNRRTQTKTQLERVENSFLKKANDDLLYRNIAMKEALRSPICNNCGGQAMVGDMLAEDHHLRIENARLKDELGRISLLANKFLGRPLSSYGGSLSQGMGSSNLELGVGRTGYGLNPMDVGLPMGLNYSNGLRNGLPLMSPSRAGLMAASGGGAMDFQYDKNLLLDLAMSAMGEFMKLWQNNSPLWIGDIEYGEVLNFDEYLRNFPLILGMKPQGYVSEASRASRVVMINSLVLIDALLDAQRWKDMFLGMIGSSSTIDVITCGTGDARNGVVQLMQGEIQLVSPLVPPRQVRFLRFCRQHAEGIWAVVDVSIDAGREGLMCRRLPSGCIVQDMPNGCSKVIWIEHNEYDENAVHQYFRPLLRSGLGFGAQKWISTLQRHSECITFIMLPDTVTEDGRVLAPGARRSLTSLAQRMTASFCVGVCGTGGHNWEMISNAAEGPRLLIRKTLNNRGDPSGAVLSAGMSVWMPMSHQRLLALLLNEELRSQWDFLYSCNATQNVIRLPKCQEPGSLNAISVLRPSNTGIILQDSATDVTGSLMVHTSVDMQAMNVVMNGGDSSSVGLVPSGFAIVPDCMTESGVQPGGEGGSLLTVGFQMPVNDLLSSSLTMESINSVVNLITRTVKGIKDVVQSDQQAKAEQYLD